MYKDFKKLCDKIGRRIIVTTSRLFQPSQILPIQSETPPITPQNSFNKSLDELDEDVFRVNFYEENEENMEKGFIHVTITTRIETAINPMLST